MSEDRTVQLSEIRDRVKKAVVEGLELSMAPEELADDEALFADLGADSTAVLEIVVALEEEFGIEVADEDLTEELMASIGSLTAYIARTLETGDADRAA